MSNTLAIDLGSTNTRLAVGNTEEKLKTEVKEVKTDPKNLENQLKSNIKRVSDEFNGSIENISIATTGLINRDKRVIKKFDTPNFEVLTDIDLNSLGSAGTDVFIENDANTAALGEQKYGNRSEKGDLIRIVMGTGIGAGILEKNEIILGSNGGAGEVGRISVRPQKNENKIVPGTWGSLCSGRGLVTLAEEFSSDLNVNSSKELFEEYRKGNQDAKEVVNKFQLFNSRAVGSLANILESEKIVFGGSLAVNNPEIVVDPLEDDLEDHVYVKKPEIGLTDLQGKAELYGALLIPNFHKKLIE